MQPSSSSTSDQSPLTLTLGRRNERGPSSSEEPSGLVEGSSSAEEPSGSDDCTFEQVYGHSRPSHRHAGHGASSALKIASAIMVVLGSIFAILGLILLILVLLNNSKHYSSPLVTISMGLLQIAMGLVLPPQT